MPKHLQGNNYSYLWQFLGSNQKKGGGMLIKNGQPPPEFQDDEGDSNLNEDLEGDSRFNNIMGLGSGTQ